MSYSTYQIPYTLNSLASSVLHFKKPNLRHYGVTFYASMAEITSLRFSLFEAACAATEKFPQLYILNVYKISRQYVKQLSFPENITAK